MTVAHPNFHNMQFTPDYIWDADDNRWADAKAVIGGTRVTLGPQASDQYLNAPEHLAMVLSRYRAAAALIGNAQTVLELGCGEGIGAGILANSRAAYVGLDTDADAVRIAAERTTGRKSDTVRTFSVVDATVPFRFTACDATVALDVIEHIPGHLEHLLLHNIATHLTDHGVCVIGTPSKNAEHLASPQSRAGHCNLYTPSRLRALMTRYFYRVQMAYMQDTSIHFGHPEMAHYILAVGIGPIR